MQSTVKPSELWFGPLVFLGTKEIYIYGGCFRSSWPNSVGWAVAPDHCLTERVTQSGLFLTHPQGQWLVSSLPPLTLHRAFTLTLVVWDRRTVVWRFTTGGQIWPLSDGAQKIRCIWSVKGLIITKCSAVLEWGILAHLAVLFLEGV